MPGRITLVGAGELMASMSSLHRIVLNRLRGTPRPVFLDTTAGFETNIDAIVAKAQEYYEHHLQTELRVARYRHRDLATSPEVAAAVAEIRAANLIFAGPGSPSYAIRQWKDSPVWESVVQQFEAGADVLFASAASITLGRYALPVYEIYKAGEDPFWIEGLDLLGAYGLSLAVVPHYNDNSGGENYDSRFCYMGARRFDMLQEQLPADVSILGIDAYTAISFDPESASASVAGQGGVVLMADGEERHFGAGASIPFGEFHSSSRSVVKTFEAGLSYGYEFSDTGEETSEEDAASQLRSYIESLVSLRQEQQVELLARLEAVVKQGSQADPAAEGALVDLVLLLREALRGLKRFDLADQARNVLQGLGYEIGDTAQGTTWTKR